MHVHVEWHLVSSSSPSQLLALLASLGYSSPLYLTFTNGIVYHFIPGTPLNENTVRLLSLSLLFDSVTLFLGTKCAITHCEWDGEMAFDRYFAFWKGRFLQKIWSSSCCFLLWSNHFADLEEKEDIFEAVTKRSPSLPPLHSIKSYRNQLWKWTIKFISTHICHILDPYGLLWIIIVFAQCDQT